MADTLTAHLLLTDQTEGGNTNSWGQLADQNFSFIDDKFGDVTAISTTGGNTNLTQTQERCNVISVTGALLSNATLIFSGRGGTWIIKNGTTGDFSLTAKVSGQSGVEISQGTTKPVYSNGTDIATGGADSSAASLPTGLGPLPCIETTPPTGWVRANFKTLGNASSNATERANADCQPLFIRLWTLFDNTILPIRDSAGTLTTRGASAAADFAANKQLPTPDLRGRTVFGLDDMGNSPASRLGTIITNPTTNGASGGTETHTLTEAQLPSHAHGLNSHTHGFSATTGRSRSRIRTAGRSTATARIRTITTAARTPGWRSTIRP